jgi:hypothetical protein
MRGGTKSPIMLGFGMQSIHKVGLMRADSGWDVKDYGGAGPPERFLGCTSIIAGWVG